MAVPRVRTPESTMNPDKSGSSLRAPGGPVGSQNGSNMGNMDANLKQVSGGNRVGIPEGRVGIPENRGGRGRVGIPENNKQAALRRLQKKYRTSGGF